MYDIYGLGNALVDTEYQVDEGYLHSHGIDKGHMTLVDETRLRTLLNGLSDLPAKRISGGSAANSIYAAQGFGRSTFYSCKVANDRTGNHFLSDLSEAGVLCNWNARSSTGTSGECLILVTPDAERSMNTFLGISTTLSEADVDLAALRQSRFFYVEGYLSSNTNSLHAAIAAKEQAEAASVKTAVSLSDTSMVNHFRESLEQMLGNGVDQLFCNEEEALNWAHTDRLDIAIGELKDIARVCNITLGAAGSLSVIDGHHKVVPGYKVHAVDTNGAGDIYAGAYLAMICKGEQPREATRFANFAAAQLVTHIGARLPSVSGYRQLLENFNG
jgi:sugar/nucleoside kinase (ribokinase family)